MRTNLLIGWLWVIPGVLFAGDGWLFSEKVSVSGEATRGVFHHLDGAGRKHIAQSNGTVAITWEDNRTGDPQVYLSLKMPHEEMFSDAFLVSQGSEAYEPSIAAISKGRFVVAWEQDASIQVQLFDRSDRGKPVRLSSGEAGQASIASFGDELFVVWRERQDGKWSLWVARIVARGDRLHMKGKYSIEKSPLQTPVLYPAITVGTEGVCIAWEDRRAGHTRILFSHSGDYGSSFAPPDHLNEFFSNRNEYDKGNGATRVSLASFAGDEILAAWMDKRRGQAGYGIFVALGAEGGQYFGPNEKAHGLKGDKQPHYNPSVAGNHEGDFVVAWDDYRSGDSDIWLSQYNDEDEWGKDFTLLVASGKGEQSHPSITLDENGLLHLIWIERADPISPTRLWYSRGKPE